MDLKKQLLTIRENGYDFNGSVLEPLCFEMMEQLGSSDGELRGQLNYSTLAHVIVEGKVGEDTLTICQTKCNRSFSKAS